MLLSACPSRCTNVIIWAIIIVNAWHSEQLEKLREIGRQLQQCRQQQSLSLQTIAAKTYIRHCILEAIENADPRALPEPVYTQGILRRYGDALGLDGAHLAQQLPVDRLQVASQMSFQTITERSTTNGGLWATLQGLPQQVVSLFDFSASPPPAEETNANQQETTAAASPATPKRDRFRLGMPVKVAAAAVGLVAVGGLAVFLWRPSLSRFRSETTIEAEPSPTPAVETPQQAGVAGNQPSPPAASPPKQQPATVPVIVEAQERCWVRVQADGELVFEGTLQPGDRQRWTAQEEITILAGNAGGLSVRKGSSGTPRSLGETANPKEVTIDTTTSQWQQEF
jgi:cytoskeletal protein RodZ